jgi:lysophospholipase L1-like esterase
MKRSKSATRSLFYNSIIFFIAIVFSMFVCDWVLGLLNFPSENPRRVSHPKNIETVRNHLEFQYVFKTNDHGLRYRNIPLEKTGTEYRIFVSGDSFTEGFGVEEENRFTSLLEKEFSSSSQPVLFINGGLGGTGPLEYGRVFLSVGLEYSPDALLICIFPNDLADTPAKISQTPFNAPHNFRSGIKKIAYTLWPRIYSLLKRFYIQRLYLKKTRTSDFIATVTRQAEKRNIPQSRITAWQASVPQEMVEAVNQGLFIGSYLSAGLLHPTVFQDSIDISSELAGKKWQNMILILSKILAGAEQKGVETAVVLIPAPFMYNPGQHSERNPWIVTGSEIRQGWLSEDTEIQKRLRQWTRAKGIAYLDLTPILRKAVRVNKNLNFELDGHWNNLGHQVAAKAIESWLSDQKVFSFVKNKSR